MTTFHPNYVRETLAMSRAAETALTFESESSLDGRDIFNAAMNLHEEPDALDKLGVEIWHPLEYCDADLAEILETEFYCNDLALRTYRDCIKRGATIAALAGTLDSDVEAWDLDHLALLGHNTNTGATINGCDVTFDLVACEWVAGDGQRFRMDHETGLPTT